MNLKPIDRIMPGSERTLFLAALARNGVSAALGVLAVCPALATDYRLAPNTAINVSDGQTSAADLQGMLLVDGDRVLLACGARYTPLQLRTHGGGTVRIAPAVPCRTGQRPVFDGRRPVGTAQTAARTPAGQVGRRGFAQQQPVVQVFAGDQPVPRARHPASGYLLFGPQTSASDTALPTDARLDPATLAGATLVARTQEWWLETRQVGADGRQLDQPLRYPLRAKAGVFFTGKAWMLGAGPGWAHDRLAQVLTVQGTGTQVLSVALDEPLLQVHGSAGVVVQGVDFFGAGGNAVEVKSNGTVVLRDLSITLTGGNAVAVAGARLAQVEQLRIERSGADGIFFAEVARAEVRDNSVRDAGLLHGPGPALAAINAQRTDAAVIERNQVERSGYIGIRFGGDALVQGNRIAQSCISLSDCAAIYTWRRGRSDHRAPVRVIYNLVLGVAGDTSVKFGVNDYFSGIYLDEWTRRAEVRGNLLLDVAQGIYLHNAFDNTVAENLVLGASAQPLLDLVDPSIRATLALDVMSDSKLGQSDGERGAIFGKTTGITLEIPNRLENALIETPAGVGWKHLMAVDVAALDVSLPQLLVIEGATIGGLAAVIARRCSRILPLAGVANLPAQALLCTAK